LEVYGYTGSLRYVIPLCILTGFLILRIDVNNFRKSKLKKEKKISSILGWTNVVLGIVLYIGNWAVNKWVQ
jgi:hypothetical protein